MRLCSTGAIRTRFLLRSCFICKSRSAPVGIVLCMSRLDSDEATRNGCAKLKASSTVLQALLVHLAI